MRVFIWLLIALWISNTVSVRLQRTTEIILAQYPNVSQLIPTDLLQKLFAPNDCYLSENAQGYPISSNYSCAPGFYCPNTTESNQGSLPQICPPTVNCTLKRLNGMFCEPQGKYEPTLCQMGYFCPNFQTKVICPVEGFFCPIGSVVPLACGYLTDCPRGSNHRFYYGGLIIAAGIDFLILICVLIVKIRTRRLREKCAKLAYIETNGLHIDALSNFRQEIRPLQFQFDKLEYNFKGKKILNGVSGKMNPGRVTAVMGPSGCGKTTLLGLLMGKIEKTGGTLLIDGKKEMLHKHNQVVGFVPQEDVMLKELTVKENISFSAKIRLPRAWPFKKVRKHIESIIQALGLSAVQYTQIGDENRRGISGGQRKRVNIGMELAACPSVLFLDEPTSGLDSTSALDVIKILKEIANLGLTVIAVIHQPRWEIFKLFDDLLLLTPNGRTAYMGPIDQVEDYFMSLGYQFEERENPPDVLMDIVSKKRIPKDKDAGFELPLIEGTNVEVKEADIESGTNPSEQKILPAACVVKNASFLTQLILNHNRYILQQYRGLSSLILEVIVASLAGFLIGFSCSNHAGYLYTGVLKEPYTFLSPSPNEFTVPVLGLLIGISVGLAGAPAGVRTFGDEKFLFWREAAAGHNRLAYFLGKSMGTVYRFTISSLHFASFFYALASPLCPFGMFLLLVWLMFYCVYGLSCLISMLVRKENGPLLSVVICLFASVFCGYQPSLRDAKTWKLDWLWGFSYSRWITEAFYSVELLPFKDVFEVERLSAPKWGYTLNRYVFDVVIAFVIGTVFRVIAFTLMMLVNRNKQK